MTGPADRVLLVDDEAAVRAALAQTLELADIETDTAGSVDEAARRLTRDWPGAVVTDVRMPGATGFDLLERARKLDPDLPVVMLTGQGDIPMAVRAMTGGAYDFLEKPCPADRLVEVARRACEKRRLVLENRRLRARLEAAAAGPEILGGAPATEEMRKRIRTVAEADVDVLVTGETGTGKELAARALHARSPRAAGPFIAVNCGALPEAVAGSELFGHEKGAFPGAETRRIGRFEQADGGAIFLDEIESMPLDLQVRLLRVLQERRLERIGGMNTVALDIRVIAATKTDLRAAMEAGRFRSDLFWRLDVARLRAPPLRERIEDAPLLFRHFVEAAALRRGEDPRAVAPDVAARLTTHDWPGNVRELRNAAERYAMGLGLTLGGDAAEPAAPGGAVSLADRVEAFERAALAEALGRLGGRVAEVCEELGLPRRTFYDKVKKYGLSTESFR